MSSNSAQAVKDKLRNISNEKNINFNAVLKFYMYDRFIERLSKSKYRDNFVNLTTLDVPIYEIPQSLTDTQKDFLAKYEETFEGNVDDYN